MAIFSHFIKNKKALGLGLLFFAFIGLSLPFTIHAAVNITTINPNPVSKGDDTDEQYEMSLSGTGFVRGATPDQSSKVFVQRALFGVWHPMITNVSSATEIGFPLTLNIQANWNIKVVNPDASESNIVVLNIRVAENGFWATVSRVALTIGSVLFNPLNQILLLNVAFQKLFGLLFYYFADFCFWLFRLILNELIESPQFSITRNPAFLTAWSQMKSYANMLIVLELVAAAVMMILNLWKDNAKKIITWVIIVALIVNFSVLVCGVLIDVSNILTRSLIGNQNFNIVEKLDQKHNELVGVNNPRALFRIRNDSGFVDPINVAKYLMVEYIFNIMYIGVAFLYLYLCLIFLQRYIYLALLFIVSPLAFAAWPFPQTSHFFNDWWRHFLKSCFIGLGAAFSIHLAVVILNAPSFGADANLLNEGALTIFNARAMLALANAFVPLIIAMGFLFYGIRLTTKTAGPLGDMVMGAVAAMTVMIVEAIATGGASLSTSMTGMAGKAANLAVKGTGKLADAVTGSDTLSKKFGESKTMQGQMESMNAALSGKAGAYEAATKKQQEEKLAEPRKRYAAISDVDRLAQLHGETRDKNERAAIIERLAQLKGLDAIKPSTDREKALEEAIAMGVSAKEIVKQFPDYAHLDKSAVREEKRKQNVAAKLTGTINPGTPGINWTKKDIEKRADELAVAAVKRDAYARKDDSDVKKMTDQDKLERFRQSVDPITGKTNAEGAQIIDEMAEKGTLGKLAKALGGLDKLAEQMNHTTETYGSDAFKAAKKSDPRLAQYDEKSINEERDKILHDDMGGLTILTATPPQIAAATTSAKNKVKADAYKKLNAGAIRKDLSEDAIDMDLIESISAKKISESNKQEGLTTKKIDKFKALLDDIENEINIARAAGDTKREAILEEKFQEIVALK